MRLQTESLKIRAEISKEALLKQAETLRSSVDNLINKIETGRLKHINSLGEIQGLGSQVDVGCMELATLLRVLEDMEKEHS